MKSPSPILRGLFVGGVGALLVSVLFSVNGWPAAELFAVLGTIITLPLYFVFQTSSSNNGRSVYARHATIVFLASGICLKSFDIGLGSYVFLIAFIALLVWFLWSVIEELPPSD